MENRRYSVLMVWSLCILARAASPVAARPLPLEYCPPLPNGAGCSDTVCANGAESCTARCVRMDGHGGITVLGCDCRGANECHVVYSPGQSPYCSGNCPPAQYCVQNLVTNELGGVEICCDCLPIQCQCPGDIDGNHVLNGLDIAGFVRCFLGAPAYTDNGGCADLDGDGYTTTADVPMFVQALLTKSACPDAPCCPRSNLSLNLATGVDDQGFVLPDGSGDDNWNITAEFPTTYGAIPRAATVHAPHASWVTFPGTKWITNEYFAGNGDFEYQYCFCLDPRFKNPALSLQVRADDQAEVYLNNNLIGSAATFNDPNPPVLTITNPGLFTAGQNCIKIVVHNIGGPPTGINFLGTMTATDGKCCCPPANLGKAITSGIYDGTAGMQIPIGYDDDTWTLITDPNGGSVPRPAKVLDASQWPWFTIGGTQWVGPTQGNAVPGLYIYQYCFCLDPRYQTPVMDLYLRADDSATIWLNGVQVGTTPTSYSFNSTDPTHVFVTDGRLFRPCQNCIEIRVTNVNGLPSPTGIDVFGSISAVDGLCCDDRVNSCCYSNGGCTTLPSGQFECPGGGAMHAGGCGPSQACCLPNGTCQTIHASCCRFMGGVVLPVNTTCVGQIQACCIPGPGGACSTCISVDPTCCIGKYGGTPQGPNTSCQP